MAWTPPVHPLGSLTYDHLNALIDEDLPKAVVVYWQVAPDYSSSYKSAFRVDTIPRPDGYEGDGFSSQFPSNESLMLIY